MDLRNKIKVYEDLKGGFMPLIMKYQASTEIDASSFYCPYIPLTTFKVPELTYNIITVKWNVVKIERVTADKLLEIAEHIDFISKIKHSNSSNDTLLLSTSLENMVYLKLKGVIYESN